ncbi:hypothetical protein D9611_009255 [Ephemerocybe angulata]|uniref:Uncharacterized protein n=1 Tax=Ephemerocybe angulata TaxID=980116 RepID=A0A8H5BH78_9AGAR|nr:hypothetical protein D9611_009255 [Tulosesus angulatus]
MELTAIDISHINRQTVITCPPATSIQLVIRGRARFHIDAPSNASGIHTITVTVEDSTVDSDDSDDSDPSPNFDDESEVDELSGSLTSSTRATTPSETDTLDTGDPEGKIREEGDASQPFSIGEEGFSDLLPIPISQETLLPDCGLDGIVSPGGDIDQLRYQPTPSRNPHAANQEEDLSCEYDLGEEASSSERNEGAEFTETLTASDEDYDVKMPVSSDEGDDVSARPVLDRGDPQKLVFPSGQYYEVGCLANTNVGAVHFGTRLEGERESSRTGKVAPLGEWPFPELVEPLKEMHSYHAIDRPVPVIKILVEVPNHLSECEAVPSDHEFVTWVDFFVAVHKEVIRQNDRLVAEGNREMKFFFLWTESLEWRGEEWWKIVFRSEAYPEPLTRR